VTSPATFLPPPASAYTPPTLHSQTQIKLFAEIMRFCACLDSLQQENPSNPITKRSIKEKLKKALDEVSEPASDDIQDPIQVMLCVPPNDIKPVKMCRAALGNYFVFKKYADSALGYPTPNVTWNHWTSVRSSKMQEKYKKDGITVGVHRGMRLLVFPTALNLPNLAVVESECYSIMC